MSDLCVGEELFAEGVAGLVEALDGALGRPDEQQQQDRADNGSHHNEDAKVRARAAGAVLVEKLDRKQKRDEMKISTGLAEKWAGREKGEDEDERGRERKRGDERGR